MRIKKLITCLLLLCISCTASASIERVMKWPTGTPLQFESTLQYKGTIAAASDFPTSTAVQSGWMYVVTVNVTDNDPTKTNTGQVFVANDQIMWNGTDWTLLGNSSSIVANYTILNEVPTPATDGAQTVFTVVNSYVAGTLQPFLDGLKQIQTTDYAETTPTTFTMVVAPAADEALVVNYIKQ